MSLQFFLNVDTILLFDFLHHPQKYLGEVRQMEELIEEVKDKVEKTAEKIQSTYAEIKQSIKDEVKRVWLQVMKLIQSINYRLKETMNEFYKYVEAYKNPLLILRNKMEEGVETVTDFVKEKLDEMPAISDDMITTAKDLINTAKDLINKSKDLFNDFYEFIDQPKSAITQAIDDILSDNQTYQSLKAKFEEVKRKIGEYKEIYNVIKNVLNGSDDIFKDAKEELAKALEKLNDPDGRLDYLDNLGLAALQKIGEAKKVLSAVKRAPLGISASLSGDRDGGDFPPVSYGRRIDVNTEKWSRYTNPENDKYLTFTDELMGHGIWLLMDGLMLNLYEVDDHLVIYHAMADNNAVSRNILESLWRWDDDQETKIYYRLAKTSIKGKDQEVCAYAGFADIDLKCRAKEGEGMMSRYDKEESSYLAGGLEVGKKMEFKEKNMSDNQLESKDAPEAKEDMKNLLMTVSCDISTRKKLMELYGA